MRLNLTLMFFTYLLAVFAWRQVSKAREVQLAIHRASLGAIMQWYFLLLVGCATMVGWTLHEFFTSYYGLSPQELLANLEKAHAVSTQQRAGGNSTLAEFQEHFSMPATIQRFSMLSNLASVLVVAIAAAHIFVKFAHPGMRIVEARDDLDASRTPWWPAPRMNRLVTLLIMPVMLCVMSTRGSCRIWALTTGQAENHFQTSFEQVEKWEVALYHVDQEVGQMFQFLGVYAFARICGSLLNESLGELNESQNSARSQRDLVGMAKELRRLVRYAGFLAVWAFIAVGVLRCVLEFLVAESHYYEVMEDSFSVLEQSFLNPINVIFSFLTVLCVINMLIVGRTQTIKERLGNANMKFMGARVLLMIIAVQEQAAQLLTADSEVHNKVVTKAMAYGHDFSAVSLTVLQADLLHLSLLNFECLFVVIFNVIVWRDLDLESSGVAGYGYSAFGADHEDDDVDEETEDQEFEEDDEMDEEVPVAVETVGGPELAQSKKGFSETTAMSFGPHQRRGAPLLLGAERNYCR